MEYPHPRGSDVEVWGIKRAVLPPGVEFELESLSACLPYLPTCLCCRHAFLAPQSPLCCGRPGLHGRRGVAAAGYKLWKQSQRRADVYLCEISLSLPPRAPDSDRSRFPTTSSPTRPLSSESIGALEQPRHSTPALATKPRQTCTASLSCMYPIALSRRPHADGPIQLSILCRLRRLLGRSLPRHAHAQRRRRLPVHPQHGRLRHN